MSKKVPAKGSLVFHGKVTMPNKHPQKHKTLRDCEHQLLIQRPSHAQAQNGEIWTCTCSKRFEHVCDEAEGCRWDLMP